MAKAPKTKVIKTNFMSEEAFADLKGAYLDALSFERGETNKLHVTRLAVPHPPKPIKGTEIARIRRKLNCSQTVFALLLNISPRTVQAWEQGARTPSDAALKLLNIAKKHPEILFET
ncbi:MAG: helix-turn-helix domain-containing protein [Pyrinomonadaceae bacterium]